MHMHDAATHVHVELEACFAAAYMNVNSSPVVRSTVRPPNCVSHSETASTNGTVQRYNLATCPQHLSLGASSPLVAVVWERD